MGGGVTAVSVNNSDLVDWGITTGSSSCSLRVKPEDNCNVTVTAAGVRVNTSTGNPGISGWGIEAQSNCKIRAKAVNNCNVSVVEQGIRVNTDTALGGISGNGLQPDPVDDCKVRVKAFCGITVDSNGVSAKRTDLMGQYLISDNTTSTCAMKVDTETTDLIKSIDGFDVSKVGATLVFTLTFTKLQNAVVIRDGTVIPSQTVSDTYAVVPCP